MKIDLSIMYILTASNRELESIIEHWEEYNSDTILLVYGQLKSRQYIIGNELKVFLYFFCKHHQYPSITEALSKFLDRKLRE